MSLPLVVNGVTYDYPEVDDTDWGAEATDWAAAVTSGMLQKAGGLFQLLAEVDFGSSYGIKSLYLKSRTANPASAGALRLARTDVVSWRNEANNADVSLSIDSSNNLLFNGIPIVGSIIVDDTDSIDLDLSASVLTANLKTSSAPADSGFVNNVLVINSDGLQVEMAEAGALTSGALKASDWVTFNGKQDAGNYITALTGDVSASGPGSAAATISNLALSKLAALTANRALVSDGSGVISAATTTATEIGYVNGVTSAIQTQLNAKVTNPMTTGGDLIYGGVSGSPTRLGNGTAGQYLKSSGGTSAPSWAALDMLNQGLMTTFTASGNFTTPSSSTTATVYRYLIIGGGGGGGGTSAANAVAGGGGAGGIAMGTFSGIAPSTSIAVTVGVGGTSGGTGGTNGGTGGTSSLASPVSVSCAGGSGGQGSTGAATAGGGAGGSVTGAASFSMSGGYGRNGYASTTFGRGGDGANSMFGGSGSGGGTNGGAGVGATGYGSGGGGAYATTAAGGVGKDGVVIIWQTTP